jgi:hypothetical protein
MFYMDFIVESLTGKTPLTLSLERVFAIGYAGRNTDKTLEHIRELERDLGVPAPKRIPTIFQCGNYVLTQEKDLHFVGKKCCGEAEYIIVLKNGTPYIGIGSDHTDRALEAQNVLKAKQICAKPIGPVLWKYEEVRDHWDSIKITSWQTVDGKEVLYQDGTLADILPMETILKELNERVGDIDNCVIYSGTVPVVAGFKYGTSFRCELKDEILGRSLSLDYNCITITEEER